MRLCSVLAHKCLPTVVLVVMLGFHKPLPPPPLCTLCSPLLCLGCTLPALTHTYGQLYLAYAPMRNTVTSGLLTSSSCVAGLAGGNWLLLCLQQACIMGYGEMWAHGVIE